jgi:hypothetical protein
MQAGEYSFNIVVVLHRRGIAQNKPLHSAPQGLGPSHSPATLGIAGRMTQDGMGGVAAA